MTSEGLLHNRRRKTQQSAASRGVAGDKVHHGSCKVDGELELQF